MFVDKDNLQNQRIVSYGWYDKTFLLFLQEIVFLACGFLRLTLVFTVFQPLHFLFGNSYVLTLNIASLCA